MNSLINLDRSIHILHIQTISLPCFLELNANFFFFFYFLHKTVYSNGRPEHSSPRLSIQILKHLVLNAFESIILGRGGVLVISLFIMEGIVRPW